MKIKNRIIIIADIERELDELKHCVATNIYKFLAAITHPCCLITIVLVYIFILYSLLLDFSLPKYPISKSLALNVSAIQHIFSFFIGTIISDWASSKYKK